METKQLMFAHKDWAVLNSTARCTEKPPCYQIPQCMSLVSYMREEWDMYYDSGDYVKKYKHQISIMSDEHTVKKEKVKDCIQSINDRVVIVYVFDDNVIVQGNDKGLVPAYNRRDGNMLGENQYMVVFQSGGELESTSIVDDDTHTPEQFQQILDKCKMVDAFEKND